MSKSIPFVFDCIPCSPVQQIHESLVNTGRMRVGVFTKYKNRNGSYITDEFARQLIDSAIGKPVVGFFDHETKDWQGHVGPTLASAYGYVESFIDWVPMVDTDGIQRDYAVFSVVVFSDYFEEAQHIMGKAQSMEINPATIEGDWAMFDGEEYYVYKTGKMHGFCILGNSHEPCFSASAFFEKSADEENKTNFEMIYSLLGELKLKVDQFSKLVEGGEKIMEEQEMIVEPIEEEVATEMEAPSVEEETPVVEEETIVVEETETDSDFESLKTLYEELLVSYNTLQEQFNTLQEDLNTIQNDYTTAQSQIETYAAEAIENANTIASLNQTIEEANSRIAVYEEQDRARENERKSNLIDSYQNLISDEEISPIREMSNDLTYDEVESRLAVTFSRNQIKLNSERKIPTEKPEESAFERLINKYHK